MAIQFYVNPRLSLCTAQQLYTSLGPDAAEREAASPSFFPRLLRTGWTLLDSLDAPDVAAAIRQLVADPRPLVDALLRWNSPWSASSCGRAGGG
jgi:hypothetical protein